MKLTRWQVFVICALFTGLGAASHAAFAQRSVPAFDAASSAGKPAAEVAAALLERALVLAEGGSWERIAVGRAWYLGGQEDKGQKIFDSVTNTREVESSDWFRI